MAERQIGLQDDTIECYVFVDDSNLWIEGQKAQGKELKDADIDPRYRADLGRFLKMVLKKDGIERKVKKAFLYGSVPPKNDSLWKALEEKKFDVSTFERSPFSGKEKEVDVVMALDILEVATEKKYDPEKQSAVFIVVTGDRDLISSVKRALKIDFISVEVWAWDSSLAKEFKQLAHEEDKLTVRKLDNVQFSFSYKEFKSKRDNIDATKAIVYRDVPRTKDFYNAIANNMCRLLQRLFYITIIDLPEKRDLIVEFPNSMIETVLEELKSFKIGNKPCSYTEYKASRKAAEPVTKLTNRYEALSKHDGCNDEATKSLLSLDKEDSTIEAVKDTHPDVCKDLDKNSKVIQSSLSLAKEDSTAEAATNTNTDMDKDAYDNSKHPWTAVSSSKAGKKHAKKDCRFGIHCKFASACSNLHTEQEKKIFHALPKTKFKYWKAKPCTNQRHFSQSPERQAQCPFAHNNTDSWCLQCLMYGHFTDNCKVK